MGVDGGKSRVVVTGLGAVTPVGNTARDFWAAVSEGRSGIGPVTAFDASRVDARIAGEVKGFDPLKYVDKKDVKKMDRFIHFAVAAGADAVDDAKLDWDHVDPTRAGCVVGSGIGGLTAPEPFDFGLVAGRLWASESSATGPACATFVG